MQPFVSSLLSVCMQGPDCDPTKDKDENKDDKDEDDQDDGEIRVIGWITSAMDWLYRY